MEQAATRVGGLPPSFLASLRDVIAVESAQLDAQTSPIAEACDLAHSMGPGAMPQIMELLGVGGAGGVAEMQQRLEAEHARMAARTEVLRNALLEDDMVIASLRARRQAALAENQELLRQLAISEGPAAAEEEALRLEQLLARPPPPAAAPAEVKPLSFEEILARAPPARQMPAAPNSWQIDANSSLPNQSASMPAAPPRPSRQRKGRRGRRTSGMPAKSGSGAETHGSSGSSDKRSPLKNAAAAA